jgi:hypothetical protein
MEDILIRYYNEDNENPWTDMNNTTLEDQQDREDHRKRVIFEFGITIMSLVSLCIWGYLSL